MPVDGPQGIPAPTLLDPPDGPAQIAAANVATAQRLNMRFANTAARDAELPNPKEGMECFVGTGATAAKFLYWDDKWHPFYTGDTGWMDVQLVAGWVQGSPGNHGQIRMKNGLVKGRGYIQRESGSIPSGYNSAFIIPSGMEPVQAVRALALGEGSNVLGIDVRGSDARVTNDGGVSASWVSLDVVSWWMD